MIRVALVDVRMPGTDGTAACEAITASSNTRVIVLTTFDLDEYVMAAIRAGASASCSRTLRPRTC